MEDEFWSSKAASFVDMKRFWPKYILEKSQGRVRKEEAGDVRNSVRI